jgi:enterochelin esterase-like enzyme
MTEKSVGSSLLAAVALVASGAVAPVMAQGSLERISVHGTALEGNLSGDDPDRDVVVYLPPSYRSEPTRHYPVVYFLHGYSVGVDTYVNMLRIPESVDAAIAAGTPEMIVVLPDAFTRYSGSMYSNSPTTGDWEAYVANDLVAYIDSHYRTIPMRGSRGLAGHSMGGYGTIRIGMKHPERFSALYAMSSCCLMNNPSAGGRGRGGGVAPPRQQDGARGGRGGGFANAASAQAAAWSPNPMNPPEYFDPAVVDGQVRPDIAARWIANSPLVMVFQYVPALKQYAAIRLDVGDQDSLAASNRELDATLTRLGIDHTFEVYEGTHVNRVGARFQADVLEFFAENLELEE